MGDLNQMVWYVLTWVIGIWLFLVWCVIPASKTKMALVFAILFWVLAGSFIWGQAHASTLDCTENLGHLTYAYSKVLDWYESIVATHRSIIEILVDNHETLTPENLDKFRVYLAIDSTAEREVEALQFLQMQLFIECGLTVEGW